MADAVGLEPTNAGVMVIEVGLAPASRLPSKGTPLRRGVLLLNYSMKSRALPLGYASI